ncbi:MAG TPA: hypothetical protein VEA19_07865, partial [Actinomycetota bacterium]|nr:hypothetical protein [Actinomycetota bacterium]
METPADTAATVPPDREGGSDRLGKIVAGALVALSAVVIVATLLLAVAHLDDLDASLPAQQLQEVGGVVGERVLEPADGQDDDPQRPRGAGGDPSPSVNSGAAVPPEAGPLAIS